MTRVPLAVVMPVAPLIHVDIVEKPAGRAWRIIGLCPPMVCASQTLHVYAGREARVLDAATDQVIVTGESLVDVLGKLATKTGLVVILTDEITWKKSRFMPRPQQGVTS